jgi:hypothetical protein
MKIFNEEQLLDESYRKLVIKDIESEENQIRKNEAKRRYDLLKDETRKYVIERLEKELNKETVEEMKHRAANISIFRKVIDKKARVYADGIRRTVDEINQPRLDLLEDALNLNTKMKQVDRVLEAQKNLMFQIVPYECHMSNMMKLKLNILHPHLYDVIQDHENPEKERVVIFSYYSSVDMNNEQAIGTYGGIRSNTPDLKDFESDGVDQLIADPDDNKEKKYYIWWSSNYHFTTDEKGKILSSESIENPIGMLPFVNFALGQDGEFWAKGGEDLADGSILINILLTDTYHIAKVQGMGLFYMFGKNIPDTIKVGPNTALTMKLNDGDPTPQIGFASSNPPLDQHIALIEKYISYLLLCNDVDPGAVGGEMQANATSGVQEIIRRSEANYISQEKRELFRDKEKEIFHIINAWMNELYTRGVLDEDLIEAVLPIGVYPAVKFSETKEYMTEEQKLNVIERRREIGLDTEIDSLMLDNPSLSKKEAEAKVLEIYQNKIMKQRMVLNGQDNVQVTPS